MRLFHSGSQEQNQSILVNAKREEMKKISTYSRLKVQPLLSMMDGLLSMMTGPLLLMNGLLVMMNGQMMR